MTSTRYVSNNQEVVSVFEVADYFQSLCEPGTEKGITHLKLQKLVYYAQGYFLAIKERPLFNERIEAWVHGPVCPELYHRHRESRYLELEKVEHPPKLNEGITTILDIVWETYGDYDGQDLEELTHQETPWIETRGSLQPWQPSQNIIDIDLIGDYFENELFGDS